MNHSNIAALAFAALALPVSASAAADGPGIFTGRMANEIEARSLLNCDQTLDTGNRNAARKPLLSTPTVSTKPDAQGNVSFTELIASMALTNNAHYSICFSDKLKGAPEAAVVYSAGATRMIALNPTLSDVDAEKALLQTYAFLKAGWNSVNEGKLERAEFEKPQGIVLDAAKPSAALPAEAPHKLFRLLREIEHRSVDACSPERDAPEASGHRILNIGLPQLHAAFENQPKVMGLLEAVNSGGYAVCFDKSLRESDDLAVVYNGKARIIALKPNPPDYDFQKVLLLAYTKVQQDAEALAGGKITAEALDQPYGIRTNSAPAPAIKTPAPHRNAALQ